MSTKKSRWCFLTVLLFFLFFTARAQLDSLSYFYEKGKTALENKDYEQYREYIERSNSIRPNHPTLLYHLILAHTYNNDTTKAAEAIWDFTKMDSEAQIYNNLEFKYIKETNHFKGIWQLERLLSKATETSNHGYDITLDNNHIESIAYHRKEKTYYLGSVNNRALYRFDPKTNQLSKWIDYHDIPEMYAVMGVASHPSKNQIWVCTSAMPEMVGFDKSMNGKVSLLIFQSKTGKLLKKALLQDDNHFGDLVIAKTGEAFVSDGSKNTIYTYNQEENKLDVFLKLSATMFNLQGLATNDNEQYLYFADYITGLYRLDINSFKVEKVLLPNELPSKGIDGLYFYNNSLIAIQNGTKPFRVLRLHLRKDGLGVERYHLIDQGTSFLGEPTQGTMVGKDFFYIANSPWAAYDKEYTFDGKEAKNLIIRTFGLKQ